MSAQLIISAGSLHSVSLPIKWGDMEITRQSHNISLQEGDVELILMLRRREDAGCGPLGQEGACLPLVLFQGC